MKTSKNYKLFWPAFRLLASGLEVEKGPWSHLGMQRIPTGLSVCYTVACRAIGRSPGATVSPGALAGADALARAAWRHP